jgi:transcriptional regulator with XRE-family HTH domain
MKTAQINIRPALEKANISQAELARLSGVDYITVNRFASRRAPTKQLGMLANIADTLGCEIADLIVVTEAKGE